MAGVTFDKAIEGTLGKVKGGMEKGVNNEFYVSVQENVLGEAASRMQTGGYSLMSLFCAENFRGAKGLTLFYAFEKKGIQEIIVLMCPAKNPVSVAQFFPSASWYEREIMDGFGLKFRDAFDERRLFLHETFPDGFHPLLKSFRNGKVETKKEIAEEYRFKEMKGEGVYQIPVGPVHAGIIEPGHFRFSVIGETIFNLEIRMFYKHRGVEKLAEGKKPEECIAIAESISGDETVANSFAFCNAAEKIASIAVPERALYLRTVYLEMERVYSLLSDMAGMVVDVAYPVGATPFFAAREEILRHNKNITGSRFMKGSLAIGGLNNDAEGQKLKALSAYLADFKVSFEEAVEKIESTSQVIDRFEKSGIVKKEILEPLHISGPIARASGLGVDNRLDHTYGIYGTVKPTTGVFEHGDVLSRFEQKAHEINDSMRIINETLEWMPEGKIKNAYKIKDGFSASLVESARGQNFHWLYVEKGVVSRYKVRTASFNNWLAIEHAVLGNIVPDFPLINKSMNLSYAGTDL